MILLFGLSTCLSLTYKKAKYCEYITVTMRSLNPHTFKSNVMQRLSITLHFLVASS